MKGERGEGWEEEERGGEERGGGWRSGNERREERGGRKRRGVESGEERGEGWRVMWSALSSPSRWAVILAFDVKVEREAQEYADTVGVKIFTADIIFHLFDKFMKHRQVGVVWAPLRGNIICKGLCWEWGEWGKEGEYGHIKSRVLFWKVFHTNTSWVQGKRVLCKSMNCEQQPCKDGEVCV